MALAGSIFPTTRHADGPALRLLPDQVSLSVRIASRHDAYGEIGRRVEAWRGASAAEVAEQLSRREAKQSTALGGGIALPHAHVSHLRSPLALFLRGQHGVAFGAPDGLPVTDFLALVVPRPATGADFELLDRLTQWLQRPDRREALVRCERIEGICDLFSQAVRTG